MNNEVMNKKEQIENILNEYSIKHHHEGLVLQENWFEDVAEEIVELFSTHDDSKRNNPLPSFLYEYDGIIKVGVWGDSDVTDEWNDYLNKIGNND